MFDRVYVINLDSTPERMTLFRQGMPKAVRDLCPTRWSAVEGSKMTLPKSWTAGKPMWGCYRTHLAILEHCILNDITSYLVFEDDCVFRDNFAANFSTFVENLPDDWGVAYLGGQLLKTFEFPPERVNEHVLRLGNVNRTHALAIHSRAYGPLYRHLNDLPFAHEESFDTHLGRLHQTREINVYGPNHWLCGQRAGVSTITHNHNSEYYWVDPGPTWEAFQMQNEPDTLLPMSEGRTYRSDPIATCPQT